MRAKLSTKARVFYLHYNKIAERRGDPKVWSVRTSRGCFHAKQVEVLPTVITVTKPKGSQPRAFLKGRGFINQFHGDFILITRTPL